MRAQAPRHDAVSQAEQASHGNLDLVVEEHKEDGIERGVGVHPAKEDLEVHRVGLVRRELMQRLHDEERQPAEDEDAADRREHHGRAQLAFPARGLALPLRDRARDARELRARHAVDAKVRGEHDGRGQHDDEQPQRDQVDQLRVVVGARDGSAAANDRGRTPGDRGKRENDARAPDARENGAGERGGDLRGVGEGPGDDEVPRHGHRGQTEDGRRAEQHPAGGREVAHVVAGIPVAVEEPRDRGGHLERGVEEVRDGEVEDEVVRDVFQQMLAEDDGDDAEVA